MKIIKPAKELSSGNQSQLKESVSAIIYDVQKHGDQAVIKYNTQFDQNQRKSLRVEKSEIKEAYEKVDSALIEHLKAVKRNIETFACRQKESLTDIPSFEVSKGIFLGHRIIPVDSCCCYVPGGNYPLFSTALMLAIPAKIAGVKRIAA